jgi:hypothetical protein
VRDEDAVVRRRPDHEHDAGGQHAQAEHRAVALVRVEQQPERIRDHLVGAPHGREHVAGRERRRRVQLGAEVVRHPVDRVGRHGRRAGQ